jgi:putative membrane protein
MVIAWILGLSLIWVRTGQGQDPTVLSTPWLLTKLAGVLFLTWWHHYLGKARKAFVEARNRRSARFWRMTNELPFLAAIVMVLAVTLELGG